MNKVILSLALGLLMTVSCNESKGKMEKAEFSGEDLMDDAAIVRNKQTKAASLNIETDGEWTLYAGTSVDNINFSQPLLKGEGSGTFSLPVNDSVRSYFQLVTENGKAILAESHLPMEGGYNFRDLGGIKNKDGKYVKWGKILRSDDLHSLTDGDLNYLSSIPIKSVVDFRSQQEMDMAPDRVPSSAAQDYTYSINPGNLMAALDMDNITPATMDSAMMHMNVLFVTDTAAIDEYTKFFELLQNENDVPLMFHCSAGKDRTGMGAALVLFSLGVDENTIMENYLESNKYLGDKYGKYMEQYPDLKPLFQVKPEFLRAGIEQIKKDHGSVENYLTDVLNVDIDKMKEMYLY